MHMRYRRTGAKLRGLAGAWLFRQVPEAQDGLQFVPPPRSQGREEFGRISQWDDRRDHVLSDRGAIGA
jgi:hypothetical protein